MKGQCINPYLPLDEYVPDGEPHVFDGRLYVFGSHDLENGKEFCELDYVAWSASVEDLSDFRYEGVIFRKEQDPYNTEKLPLYAPDVVKGPDGRYYLYYCVKFQDSIHVAVCDTPTGKYEFYGRVHYPDGKLMTEGQPYDPSLICCEEGNFLYFGFAPCMIHIPRYEDQDLKGGSVLQLEDDMLTVKKGPSVVIPSLKYGAGTSFEGNEYFEGPSIRKIGSKFYLVYSSVQTHKLCYAVSSQPMEGFSYGGVIISSGDVGYQGRKEEDKLVSVGNNHGGLVCVKGQWYIFYHRHTSTTQYNRQGCAEKIYFDQNGKIPQVTVTTSGMSEKPLPGIGSYPAVYCCNLTNGHMGALSSIGRSNTEMDFPYITCQNGERYLTNIKSGTMIGYKYIALQDTGQIEVVFRGNGNGTLQIKSRMDKEAAASIQVAPSEQWKTGLTDTVFSEEEKELYLVYQGSGSIEICTLNLLGK